MANKLFKSIFAVIMTLGSALGFVSCEELVDVVVGDPSVEVSATSLNFTMEEGSQSVDITANADWKVESDVDWLTVTPAAGNGDAKITIAVAMNDTGAVRGQEPDAGNLAAPGTVLSLDRGIEVACGVGSVIFTVVTPEGKGRMNAADYIRGRKVNVGDVLN